MATSKRKQQVTEADKSPAATGDLVADTGTASGQAEPNAPTGQEPVTTPEAGAAAVEKEPVVQEQVAEPNQEEQSIQEDEKEEADAEPEVMGVDMAHEQSDLTLAVDTNQPDWVIGHMDVKAKSPIGFWRCGYFFARDMATRVYVVTRREDVTQAAGHDDFAVYVEEAEAKRIYREPNLVILIDGEIIRG